MEVGSPTRSSAVSSYRDSAALFGEPRTFDRNAEPTPNTLYSPVSDCHSVSSSSHQTIQWPFHHPTSSSPISSHFHSILPFPTDPFPSPLAPPTAAWTVGSASSRPSRPGTPSSIVSLVPDYVRNFIRGDTPEVVALRRQTRHALEAEARTIRTSTTYNVAAPLPTHGRRPTGMGIPTFASPHPALMNRRRSRTACDSAAIFDARRHSGKWPRGGGGVGGGGGSFAPRSVAGASRLLVSGWRTGVAVNALIAILQLLLVLVGLIVTVSTSSISQMAENGTAVAFEGACARANAISWSLSALANAFGVILLAGANYTFQVLSSPTRRELDRAHGWGRWLDIGIPSVRNLAAISGWRVVVIGLVMLIALVTLVIYNSIISISQLSPTGDLCRVTVSAPLLCVIALLNLFAVLILVAVMTRSRFEPLVSVGDALASYLTAPDPTTEDACLITKADIRSGKLRFRELRFWAPSWMLWLHSVSARRWALWIATWALPTGLSLAGLLVVVQRGNAAASIRAFGRANLTPETLVTFAPDTANAVLVLATSLPHLLLAALYLSTNAHLSTYFLSHEFSQFAAAAPGGSSTPGSGESRGIPLRVTSGRPVGEQTTSLYLTLPRPFSWLLVALFAAAGFLLGQALVVVDALPRQPPAMANAPPITGSSAVAFVPGAMLGVLVVLFAVAAVVLSLGTRGVQPVVETEAGQSTANPLALRGGSCSAVISARAHPLDAETDVARRRLAWGVVREGDDVGSPARAGFSGWPVGLLSVGSHYA